MDGTDGLTDQSGLEVVAGLLYVPLSRGGRDFIAFLRRGQPRSVKWAGKPYKDKNASSLEPRRSFKTWAETVAGRCRAWTDEQLETAGVLALVYGKVGTWTVACLSCLRLIFDYLVHRGLAAEGERNGNKQADQFTSLQRQS